MQYECVLMCMTCLKTNHCHNMLMFLCPVSLDTSRHSVGAVVSDRRRQRADPDGH